MVLAFFVVDEDEPSSALRPRKIHRMDWIRGHHDLLVSSCLSCPRFGKAGRIHVSTSVFLHWHRCVSQYADIVGLFLTGIPLVLLYSLWQYYFLELSLENTNLPRTRWMAPPFMKLSIWTHAHDRFAVMQIITYVNREAVSCLLVWLQLYCRSYLRLTPIRTMLRILPMFLPGILTNIVIELTVGRIDVVYVVGASLTSASPFHGLPDFFFALTSSILQSWAHS